MKTITYKITDAAIKCKTDKAKIEEFIMLEWICPYQPNEQILDDEDLARINLILELKEELGVNDESVPIILHLIDELNHLHLGLKKDIIH